MERSSTEAEKRERGNGSPTEPVRRDYAPAGTYAKPTLFGVLRRTATEFSEDNLTDWAAALTYYGLLALFPALIALVAILGLFADPKTTSQKITEIVTQIGPSSGAQTFSGPIKSITSNQSAAGILFVVGLVGALWSASGYVGAFMRASNVIYEVPEGRPFWKLRPLQIVVTIVITLLVALVAIAIVLTGPLAKAVGDVIGLGGAAVTAWSIAKWPVLFLVVLAIVAVLYYASPNVRLSGFRWITPGTVLAVVVWLVASAGFGLYVAAFSSYNKTYGTLGAVIVFLVWLWISNNALLLGAELNAELERERELASGQTEAEDALQLPPRTEPKRR